MKIWTIMFRKMGSYPPVINNPTFEWTFFFYLRALHRNMIKILFIVHILHAIGTDILTRGKDKCFKILTNYLGAFLLTNLSLHDK